MVDTDEKSNEESRSEENTDIKKIILMKTEEEWQQEQQLEWINLRREIATTEQGHTFRDKLIRKTKENPFVPIGLLATSGILCYGLWMMKSGQTKKSQQMMRWRVAAQGFTVIALLVGLGISSLKKPE